MTAYLIFTLILWVLSLASDLHALSSGKPKIETTSLGVKAISCALTMGLLMWASILLVQR